MLIMLSKKVWQHRVITLCQSLEWKGQKENYVIINIVPKHKNVRCRNCDLPIYVGSCKETLAGISSSEGKQDDIHA